MVEDCGAVGVVQDPAPDRAADLFEASEVFVELADGAGGLGSLAGSNEPFPDQLQGEGGQDAFVGLVGGEDQQVGQEAHPPILTYLGGFGLFEG